MLIPSLIKLFGPTLARVLLTLALKDDVAGGDIAETLTESLGIPDIVDRLTDDRRAKQKGAYLFTTLGEDVAESLNAVFELEGETLSPAQKDCVIKTAADTMEKYAVPLLLENDLDLTKFTVALLRLDVPTVLQEDVEKEFYSRVLRECTQRLHALSDDLPYFTRETMAEVLRRTSDMDEKLNTIIANQEQIYRTSHAGNDDALARDFERQYRTLLVDELDRLPLFGAQIEDYRPPLTVGYVTISVRQEQEQKLPAPKALAKSNRILLIGRAGSGKTTLLKWVAVRTAQQEIGQYEDILARWQDKIPFYLRLRDFAQGALPAFDTLPIQTRGLEHLSNRLPDHWTHTQFEQGRALLLVDGLDEVNTAKREEAYAWLQQLLTLYPQTIYLVTTRPSTLQDQVVQQRFQHLGFTFLRLQDMDNNGVEQLVQQWHQAMAHEKSLLPDEKKAELPQLAKRLTTSLERHPRLQALARSPLLAAMICALNRVWKSNLPDDRLKLYQACIEMLMTERDDIRKVDISEYGVTLSGKQLQQLLSGLAYQMLNNNEPVVHMEDAKRYLRGHQQTEAVLNYLVDRSGLLQRQSADEFDFVHRTFQEYLAAQDILYRGDIPAVIRDHSHDEEWHETIRLIAGLTHDARAQQKVLQKLMSLPMKGRPIHILALECYSLMTTYDEKTLASACKHAAALVEKESQSLDLSDTQVTDLIPLTELIELRQLGLNFTQVRDLAPLAHSIHLEILDLAYIQIKDLTPLANLDKLKTLSLAGADLRYATLNKVNLQGAELIGTELFKADLCGADLRGADMSEAILEKALLQGTYLCDVVLKDAVLSDADLRNADLSDANLKNADLRGADLTNATLSRAKYNHDTQWPEGFDYQNSGAIGPYANLHSTDLSHVDLSDADLRGTKYNDYTKWPTGFDYQHSGAIGPHAYLRDVDLRDVDLHNTDLRDTDLRDADLNDRDLSNVNLSNSDLRRAKYNRYTKWPSGFKYQNSGAIGPFANLRNTNLSDTNLRNADLSNANLSDANLNNASLSNADLSNANLHNACLRKANLSNANLSNANLSNADLSNTDLKKAIYTDRTKWPIGFDYWNSGARTYLY